MKKVVLRHVPAIAFTAGLFLCTLAGSRATVADDYISLPFQVCDYVDSPTLKDNCQPVSLVNCGDSQAGCESDVIYETACQFGSGWCSNGTVGTVTKAKYFCPCVAWEHGCECSGTAPGADETAWGQPEDSDVQGRWCGIGKNPAPKPTPPCGC